jgi:2-succinyl-5-enolpyruvyl-6-hydroxy-3-cyclohexene-1-carboxylate synthase
VALLGDHSFLYDSNALLTPAEEERPDLVIVVIDNDGGGIFSTLEQGAPEHAATFDRVFGVPLGIDLVHLSLTLGIPAEAAATAEALQRAVDEAIGLGGVRVVVARTCSREREAQILTDVQTAVSAALELA